MELDYFTRDGKGNDFVKKVAIKEFPIESVDFECPVCHRHCTTGSCTKNAYLQISQIGNLLESIFVLIVLNY